MTVIYDHMVFLIIDDHDGDDDDDDDDNDDDDDGKEGHCIVCTVWLMLRRFMTVYPSKTQFSHKCLHRCSWTFMGSMCVFRSVDL